MQPRRLGSGVALALLIAAGTSCATSEPRPTLTLEQHSLRIPLTVGSDGAVSLSESPPLVGRIDLVPILNAEKIPFGGGRTVKVQLVVHYGRIYVVGASFHSVWEITPRAGTSTASYRPIPAPRNVARAAVREVRLSRYGSAGSSCLRVDGFGADPFFITEAGDIRDVCP
jgi:hypothetical protein